MAISSQRVAAGR
ncbi:hypothetical protein YPPY88_3215, partial [Yersinia pestis PY-88]